MIWQLVKLAATWKLVKFISAVWAAWVGWILFRDNVVSRFRAG
ncbi:MAG TPA: hypothetical protein VHJ40_06110 [Actinomycetota bacterium]|nr:hypothetical protein [Actinomycetota bacterium]